MTKRNTACSGEALQIPFTPAKMAAEVTQESIEEFVVVSTPESKHLSFLPAANNSRSILFGAPALRRFTHPGASALCVRPKAARYGDMEDVQSYLSQGVSPDAVDVEGRTALFFASANGHLEVVDVLLEKEAVSDATSTWPTPCTLLDWRDVLSI